ncbi:MAG: YveK family protein [Bacillota bacterium]
MEEQEVIDLREYFAIIRRRLWAIILVTVVAVATSGVISYFFIEPVYSASTTLMILKKDSPGIDYTTLLMNRQLVKTYGEIAKSRTVAEHVLVDLSLDMTTAELQGAIHVNTVRDTELIQIRAESTIPAQAELIANAVAKDFIRQVVQIMKVENVQVVDPAIEPTAPVKPRPKLNMAVAGVLGIMVGVGLAFVLEYLDNTVKSPEDVRRYLDLPVLGTIPVIDLRQEAKMARRAADRAVEPAVIKRGTQGDDRGIKAVK